MTIDERFLELTQRLDSLAAITSRAFDTRDQKIAALASRLNEASMRIDVLEDSQYYEKLETSSEEFEAEDEESAEQEASRIVYLEPSETLAE